MTSRISTQINKTAYQFASYFPAPWRPHFYVLWSALSEGHICVPQERLDSPGLKEIFPETPVISDPAELISDGSIPRPMVEMNGKIYLHRYFIYETVIADTIKRLIAGEPAGDKSLGAIPGQLGMSSAQQQVNWQLVAAAACLRNQFTIITGGPGTGKTTTVATILQWLFAGDPDLEVALAAPTGKAAARMAESLKEKAASIDEAAREKFNRLEPSTIHRLLGSKRNSAHFVHNRDNVLPFDIIIIDESSMIDVALFAKLLDAVGPRTKLILLGDKNQLASVEAGSLFGDLCNIPDQMNAFSEPFRTALQPLLGGAQLPAAETISALSDHIVELQKSYRFSSEKGIGRISDIIIREDVAALQGFIAKKDEQVVFDFDYDDQVFQQFALRFKSFIEEQDIATALKKLNESRILCAVREGQEGLYETNRRVEAVLEKMKLIRKSGDFYENRPVIITRNNYQLGLFNGDTGIVRRDEAGVMKVWFDINGELTGFATSLISNEETAFAITIHKSQGSEFDQVLVLLPAYDMPLLTKELVYTAVTRAKNRVIIQSDEHILKQAIGRSVQRGSGLKERFIK